MVENSWTEKIDKKKDQIDKTDQKIAQLEAQKKQLRQQIAVAERKARTKRLIETGGGCESAIGVQISGIFRERFCGFLQEHREEILALREPEDMHDGGTST